MTARSTTAAAIMMIALAASDLWPGAAHAGDSEPAPSWRPPVFPPVFPPNEGAAATPDEVLDRSALGIIRVGDREWRAFRGSYRDFVAQDDFLISVGRPDLAERLRSSRRTANLLWYGGVIAGLTGLAFLFADVVPGGFQPSLWLPLGLAGGGFISCVASSSFGHAPASQDEAEAFANRYNELLRAHSSPQPRGTVARALFLRLQPWFDPQGGKGVFAGIRF